VGVAAWATGVPAMWGPWLVPWGTVHRGVMVVTRGSGQVGVTAVRRRFARHQSHEHQSGHQENLQCNQVYQVCNVASQVYIESRCEVTLQCSKVNS
jgi:hypothetical protein